MGIFSPLGYRRSLRPWSLSCFSGGVLYGAPTHPPGSPIDMTGAREVYKVLKALDRHIGSEDASGRVLLYEAKQRIRKLIISIDRSNASPTL